MSVPLRQVVRVGAYVVKQHLAGYKAPKRVLFVDSIGRAANGKVDYAACKATAVERLAPVAG